MSNLSRRIRSLSDAEEARIQKLIASDADSPEATDEQLAQAKPFSEAFPDLAASIKRGRGRPKGETAKAHVSLRLDADVLAAFKATGTGWQSRINAALKVAAKKLT